MFKELYAKKLWREQVDGLPIMKLIIITPEDERYEVLVDLATELDQYYLHQFSGLNSA